MDRACRRRPGPPLPPVRSPVSPNAVEPGTRLVDRYRLEEHLGGGGRHDVLAGPGRAARPAGRASACLDRGADRSAEPGAAGRAPGRRPHRRAVPAGAGRQRGRRRGLRRQRMGRRHQPGRPARRRTAAARRGPRPRPGRRRGARRGAPGRAGPPVPAARARAAHHATARSRSAGLAVDAAVRGIEPAGAEDARRAGRGGRRRVALRRADRAVAGRPRHRPAGRAPRRGRAVQPAAGPGRRARTTSTSSCAARCRSPAAPGGPLRHAWPHSPRHSTAVHLPAGSAAVPGRRHRTGPARRPCRRTTRSRARAAGAGRRAGLGRGRSGAGRRASRLAGWPAADRSAATATARPPTPATPARAGAAVRPRGDRPAPGRGGHHLRPAAAATVRRTRTAAELVVDGDPSTVWTTKEYFDPSAPAASRPAWAWCWTSARRSRSARSRSAPWAPPTSRCAPRTSRVPRWTTTPRRRPGPDADGRAVVVPPKALQARYVLVWLTSLPADDGRYRGQIAEVAVRD